MILLDISMLLPKPWDLWAWLIWRLLRPNWNPKLPLFLLPKSKLSGLCFMMLLLWLVPTLPSCLLRNVFLTPPSKYLNWIWNSLFSTLETGPKITGQDQNLTINKKSTTFELSSWNFVRMKSQRTSYLTEFHDDVLSGQIKSLIVKNCPTS